MSDITISPIPPLTQLDLIKRDIFSKLRVCVPGSIAAVNAENGTVDVAVGLMQRTPKLNMPRGVPVSYPLLEHCPLFTVQGGGVGAVMPVSVGDGCLVVFSDRCIEAWFATGQPNPLPSFRMHDISDGFALVGVNSLQSLLNTPLDPGEGGLCETKNAFGVKVAINPTTHKVTVQNDTQNLFTVLTNLVTALAALNTAIATTSPTNIASAQTIAVTNETAITAVQTALAALLY